VEGKEVKTLDPLTPRILEPYFLVPFILIIIGIFTLAHIQ
jgi:hypothetical protein